jgi:outer membrane protein
MRRPANTEFWQKALSIALSGLCLQGPVWPQQLNIVPLRPSAPLIVRPYQAVTVPPVRVANSPRLAELIRGGTLYLTAQDAIALALENNIDLEVARYNPIMASWRVQRAEAGGALPGVPSAAAQAGTVAIGQGVSGSQAAAGVRIAGGGGGGNQSANATITQIGPVTQTLDPSIQESSTFSHTSTPQANSVQSITSVLIANTRAHSGTYQQGFLSGGAISVRYTNNYLNENSPTDLLNPSSAPNLSVSAQHNLLRGFGIAVNARTITVAKMNAGMSDLTFRSQVINVVTQVLNLYYNLAADYENVKARRTAADVAEKFQANVKEQIQMGTVAPPEAINAEQQVVTSRQAVVDAEATLKQREIQMKNLISRTGTGDPILAGVRILPVDPIIMPAKDDLPPLEELIRRARANRPDLLVQRQSDEASAVSALGTRNGLLPNLQVFGAQSNAGLSGTARTVVTPAGSEAPDPYFVGGIGTGLGQVFRRNFPTERVGTFIQVPLRNRQARSDYAIDQMQLRQSQLSTRKSLNQVEVDVMNNVIALQQARARYESAVQNRILQEKLVEGERERYAAGASTPYNVIQQQRDLVTAEAAQLSALVAYNAARIALDQAVGNTLEANHVSIAEARDAKVSRISKLPAP